MTTIDLLIQPEELLRLSGQGSFDRGSAYAKEGRVIRLEREGNLITGRVEGSHPYRVELEASEDGLRFFCDCPVGDRGSFCKHCVAVALVAAKSGGSDATPPGDRIRPYLESLSRESLIELLSEEADMNDPLLDRLALRADIHSGEFELDRVRKKIHREIFPRGFVDYRDSPEYAQRLYGALDLLDLVVTELDSADTVTLVEFACRSAEKAAGKVDDSDGFMSVAFDRLQVLHHEACRRAGFDSEVLAARLFKLMMKTHHELFYDAVDRYADLLGEAGEERYANLVRVERERLPDLGPGDDPYGSDGRFRIEYVSERLARRSGDVDQLVETWSGNLSRPYMYLRIAEALAEAGRQGEAIEWAERGIEAFPDHNDTRLITFLADLLSGWGEHERALDLAWRQFERRPWVESYEHLKTIAEEAGNLDETRERALALLRERVETFRQPDADEGPGSESVAADVLVQIHLMEGDPEAALEAARDGGCQEHTWLKLAERLEATDPGAAADIYRGRIEPTIDRKTKADYRDAVRLIVQTGELLTAAGRGDEFPVLLEGIRETHRRKRSFIELLAQA